MTELMDILARVMNIFDRVRSMEQLSAMAMAGFGIVLVFGVLNCILGYRLLRFWMMLGALALARRWDFSVRTASKCRTRWFTGVRCSLAVWCLR